MRLTRNEIEYVREYYVAPIRVNVIQDPRKNTPEYLYPIAVLANEFAMYPLLDKLTLINLIDAIRVSEISDYAATLDKVIPRWREHFIEVDGEIDVWNLEEDQIFTAVCWAYCGDEDTGWRSLLGTKVQE